MSAQLWFVKKSNQLLYHLSKKENTTHVCYFFFSREIMYVTSLFFLETDLWKTPPPSCKNVQENGICIFWPNSKGTLLLSPVRCFLLCFSLGWTEIPARLTLTACMLTTRNWIGIWPFGGW